MKPARAVVLATTLSVVLAIPAACSPELLSDLEWIWHTLRTKIFDYWLADRYFTEGNRSALADCARAARSEDELAAAVNSLLDSLKVSHLRLFTESDLEYYLYRSMIVTHDPATPPVNLVGMQCTPAESAYVVRAVWDGYPAERAGLQRGDVILASDGERFQPVNSFCTGGGANLAVLRRGAIFHVQVDPVQAGVNASLLQAMKNSIRHSTLDGHEVGYVHLWSGTSRSILREFTRIVTEEFRDAEGMVLDLRDGWGGAWYDYLDPFFEDRSDFYVSTEFGRTQQPHVTPPPPVGPHAWFRGPLVVLINEGTRSGKEALAFQFKKSKRAVLVGATTAGAFTAGGVHSRGGFVLYVPVYALLLDGKPLEGVGVAPDVRVDDPVERPSPGDPQLERGLEELRHLLSGQ